MSGAVVMLGPPGSGKGTQAKKLAQHLRVPHISTGDMLRDAVSRGTELGKKAGVLMASGQLVPDELVDGIVRERLKQADAAAGFILDGYPRTQAQARALDEVLHGGAVVALNIEVGEEELVRRISGRRTCKAAGHIFHVESSPSPAGDVCDQDGSPLVQRPDDNEQVVRRRLSVYRKDTAPVIEHYRGRPGFHSVDGARDPEAVFQDLRRVVNGA